MLNNFRLEHIRQFVCAARELHFGRAAQQLSVTQPALSRTIGKIESAVGVELFDRTRRQIGLTAAGRAFNEEAVRLLSQAALAERMAARAAAEHPVLRVGGVESAVFGLLPSAVRAFRTDSPAVPVSIEERTASGLIDGLRDGSLDLAVIHDLTGDLDQLQIEPVYSSRLEAVVPTSWPIARRSSLKLRDLAKFPFVFIAPAHSPSTQGDQLAACRIAGFLPNIVYQAATVHTLLAQVSSEAGISFGHALMQRMTTADVKFIPITDAPKALDVTLAVVWIPRSVLPAMHDLIACIRLIGRGSGRKTGSGRKAR